MVDAMNADTQLTAPQFWKKFTIKEAVNHISTSWNAIKSESLNGIWRLIWPEVVNNFKGFECQKIKVTQDFIQLGKEVRDDPGFQNLNPDDVEQLVQEMDAPFTVEDAVHLSEEPKGRENEADEIKEVKRKDTEPAIKDWSITTLQTLMTSVEEMINIIKENDPDMERSMEKMDALRRVTSDYKRLLDRKICERRQSSIKSFFTSSQGSAESLPRPESDVESESLESFFTSSQGSAAESLPGPESDSESESLESQDKSEDS